MSANKEPNSVEKTIEQCIMIQSMIDFTAKHLYGLRTQCATTEEITQSEIRETESKLIKLFSKQLVAKARFATDDLTELKKRLSDYPSTEQWLNVVGVQTDAVKGIVERGVDLDSLLEMSDEEVKNLLLRYESEEEDLLRLSIALKNLKFWTDKQLCGDKSKDGDIELHWSSYKQASNSPYNTNSPKHMQRPSTSSLPPDTYLNTQSSQLPTPPQSTPSSPQPNQVKERYRFTPPPTPPLVRPKSGEKKYISTPPPKKKMTLLQDIPLPLTKSKSHESQLASRVIDVDNIKPSKKKPHNLKFGGSYEALPPRCPSNEGSDVEGNNALMSGHPASVPPSPLRSPPIKQYVLANLTDDFKPNTLTVPRSPKALYGSRMMHAINHRFGKTVNISTCDYCHNKMFFGYKCKECKFKCHRDCAQKAPPSCSLPNQFVQAFINSFRDGSPNAIRRTDNPTLVFTSNAMDGSGLRPMFQMPDSSSNTSSCNSSTPSSPALGLPVSASMTSPSPGQIPNMKFEFPGEGYRHAYPPLAKQVLLRPPLLNRSVSSPFPSSGNGEKRLRDFHPCCPPPSHYHAHNQAVGDSPGALPKPTPACPGHRTQQFNHTVSSTVHSNAQGFNQNTTQTQHVREDIIPTYPHALSPEINSAYSQQQPQQYAQNSKFLFTQQVPVLKNGASSETHKMADVKLTEPLSNHNTIKTLRAVSPLDPEEQYFNDQAILALDNCPRKTQFARSSSSEETSPMINSFCTEQSTLTSTTDIQLLNHQESSCQNDSFLCKDHPFPTVEQNTCDNRKNVPIDDFNKYLKFPTVSKSSFSHNPSVCEGTVPQKQYLIRPNVLNFGPDYFSPFSVKSTEASRSKDLSIDRTPPSLVITPCEFDNLKQSPNEIVDPQNKSYNLANAALYDYADFDTKPLFMSVSQETHNDGEISDPIPIKKPVEGSLPIPIHRVCYKGGSFLSHTISPNPSPEIVVTEFIFTPDNTYSTFNRTPVLSDSSPESPCLPTIPPVDSYYFLLPQEMPNIHNSENKPRRHASFSTGIRKPNRVPTRHASFSVRLAEHRNSLVRPLIQSSHKSSCESGNIFRRIRSAFSVFCGEGKRTKSRDILYSNSAPELSDPAYTRLPPGGSAPETITTWNRTNQDILDGYPPEASTDGFVDYRTHSDDDIVNTNTSNDSDKTLVDSNTSEKSLPERVDSLDSQDDPFGHNWNRQNSLSVTLKEWDIPFEDLLVGDELGTGRFGTVYRGHWHGDVAIKMLNMDPDKDNQAQMSAFKLEVAMLRKTRHENLVLFMGACMKPPRLAIVTSLCKGKTLFTHIHSMKEKFPMSKTVIIASQIAQGMGYLHARGIIHKDLKTKNIFLERDRVIITDFGLFNVTKLCGASRKGNWLSIPPGWLCYLSPEIICSLQAGSQFLTNRELPFSEQSDVYAFGTVWYELLTGEWPFKKLPAESIIWKVGKGLKQSLHSVQASRDVKDVLMICWTYKPSDRPDFSRLLKALERLPKKRLLRSPSHPVHLSRSAESVI